MRNHATAALLVCCSFQIQPASQHNESYKFAQPPTFFYAVDWQQEVRKQYVGKPNEQLRLVKFDRAMPPSPSK